MKKTNIMHDVILIMVCKYATISPHYSMHLFIYGYKYIFLNAYLLCIAFHCVCVCAYMLLPTQCLSLFKMASKCIPVSANKVAIHASSLAPSPDWLRQNRFSVLCSLQWKRLIVSCDVINTWPDKPFLDCTYLIELNWILQKVGSISGEM